MKRIGLLGLALVAVVALGALASASALAENPEILPVPSAGTPANFTSEAGEVRLVTTGGTELACTKATNKGSFTSQDLGTVAIKFEGCKTASGKCNSPGQAGGVVLTEGSLDLVDILPGGTLDLGVAITPHQDGNPSEMLSFVCGGIATILYLGALIGVIDNSAGSLLKDLEKFKELKALWKQSSTGEQEIKECMFLKAFCEGKKFLLEVDFGLGHELGAFVGDATFKFEKEYEVHF